MTNDLIERIIIQLEPSLAQQFIAETTLDGIKLKAFELILNKNVIIPKLTLTQNFDIKEYNKGLSETRQLTNEERIIILEALKVLQNEQKD